MKTHFEFSIFTADGQAYGRSGKYLDTIKPDIGQTLSIFQLAATDATNVDLPHSAINELMFTKVEEIDVLPTTDTATKGQYFSVQLSDVVFENTSIASKAIRVMSELGFDCDVW